MLELKGSNLGKRQQELNKEVLKTVSENIDFSLIEDLEEHSDVDRLYKIDIAIMHNNVDYIIKTLKCGDTLYISRALKCPWLYDNDFSAIISPDYLHHEVFPFMSIKMKNKLLTTISMHVRDEKRSEEFYKYCLTDKKLKNIAEKFLIWTSEQHKMEYLSSINNIDIKKIKNIIGHSLTLATAYLEKQKSEHSNTNDIVHEFRYLINTSNEKYLNLMESYTEVKQSRFFSLSVPQLGLRLSKEIITKHKDRVLKNVPLYFKKLNLSMIAKHSSIEDVKQYAIALLPATAEDFWSMDFYQSYKTIFNILPQNEVYSFLREIFVLKYENKLFEMSKEFHSLKYYLLLTNKEREMWALEHLKQNNEFFGPDSDYFWYQFVNYDLAFSEIKKLVAVCRDGYKRADMIKILIDSANNEEKLEKLLNYYYVRHVNESNDHKMSFIDSVYVINNIFKFGEPCWNAFSKILYSTKMFSSDNSTADNKYKSFIILYHILHDKEIPKLLEAYVISKDNANNLKYEKEDLYKNLTDKQIHLVCETFITLCVNKLIHFDNQAYDTIKDSAREIIDFALLIMETFDKVKDDCPDVILKYVKIDWSYYKDLNFFAEKEDKITEAKLLKQLKLDFKLLLKVFPHPSYSKIKINNLLKKIRVYFPNDLAKDWVDCCESLLEQEECQSALLNATVIAIFHIGSDDYKKSFVSKYVPEDSKISHDKIDRKILTIQEGICRFALYSRPPVPLEHILPYIKGDYVRYCLPMFGSYINQLPIPQSVKFVSAILNTPVSIQKHGLRLAFQCFKVDDLTNIIVNVWESTKNVSLRMTIYKAVFEKIKNVDQNSQRKLYEVLKMMTLDLNENDDDYLFRLLSKFDLLEYKDDFLQNAWITVQKLSENTNNISRKVSVLSTIDENFGIIDKEFLYTAIIHEFITVMLTDNHIGDVFQNDRMNSLNKTKWKLAANYIIHVYYDQKQRSQELVQLILQRCSELWNITVDDTYMSRNFLFWFIKEMLQFTYYCQTNKTDSIPALEYILKLLCEILPITQMYLLYVELNLVIISKRVIGSSECNYDHLVQENIAKGLATEVDIFLQDLKDKKMLYPNFMKDIKSLLCDAIDDVVCSGTNINSEELTTLLSDHLLESQLYEAHLLALYVLPRRKPKKMADKWLDIIGKALNGENDELKIFVHEKILYQFEANFY